MKRLKEGPNVTDAKLTHDKVKTLINDWEKTDKLWIILWIHYSRNRIFPCYYVSLMELLSLLNILSGNSKKI